jgi:hypothetical protein
MIAAVTMFAARISPVVWGGIAALAALAVPTWRFGWPFLRQFFVSPFQFFIVPLWLLAYYSVRTGAMPMRSGPPLRRDENPAEFRRSVRYTALMGAAMFVFNLWISWQVMSRHDHRGEQRPVSRPQ